MSTDDHPDESSRSPSPAPLANDSSSEPSAAAKFRDQVASKQQGLDDYDPEEKLWSGGYSPKAMIGSWFLMAVISVVLLIAPLFVPPSLPLSFPIAIAIIAVIWVVGGLRYVWRRLGVHYALTSQRFVHKSGILTRETDRIEVIDIDDVSYRQGPVQRTLGVGTIIITSSDRSHPVLTMVGIDKVSDVAGLIDDIRRTERRKRSLHIESI